MLTEYEEAHRYAIHLDELNWHVGSILIGGSLAAVVGSNVVASQKAPLISIFIELSAIVALISWFLFIRRNGGFAEIATGRMAAIEK
jgi:hypothetical protein